MFDKETRIVCIDIREERHKGEDGSTIDGYSFIQVEIDRQIDYGHIKSQIIEAGFAQKDEFGLLMNAVDGIVMAVRTSESWEEFRDNLNTEDVIAFSEFCDFREMCAKAAHEVLSNY